MASAEHPKTGVIREIVKLGHALYEHSSFRMEMDKPSCELGRQTPRELIRRGQAGTVLEVVTAAFESQRV